MSIMKGLVEENTDPLNRGRIKIRYKETLNTSVDSLDWAEYCSPMGGGRPGEGAGFIMIPNVGDTVWFIYEESNPGKKVWLGFAYDSLLGETAIPVESQSKGVEPLNRVIKTKLGHTIEMDDRFSGADARDGMRITTAKKQRLDMNDAGSYISLTNITGQSLQLKRTGVILKANSGAGLYINDDRESQTIMLTSPGDRSFLKCEKDSVVIKGDAVVSIISSNTAIDAENKFEVKTKGEANIKSADFKLNTGESTTITAGSKMKLTAMDSMGMVFGGGGNCVIECSGTVQAGTGGMIQFEVPKDGQILMRTNGIPNQKPLVSTDMTSGNAFTGAAISTLDIPDLAGATGSVTRLGTSAQSGSCLVESWVGAIAVLPSALSGKGIAKPSGTQGGIKSMGITAAAQAITANLTLASTSIVSPMAMVATYTTTVPAGHPAVLGDNLLAALYEIHAFLTQLVDTVFIQNGASFTIGQSPGKINPAIDALMQINSQWLSQFKTRFLDGDQATALLSPHVIID